MYRGPSLSIALAILALPLVSQAQDKSFGGYPTADMQYCARLSDLYVRYVGRSEAGPRTPVAPDVIGGVALTQCKEGKTAEAIPVLERELLDARFTLPPRA